MRQLNLTLTMRTKTNITDIQSLRLAKAEVAAEIAQREIKMKIKAEEIQQSFFDFSSLKQTSTDLITHFIDKNISPITSTISSFIIKKVIKPKNKWVRKLSILASTLLIQKYSGTLQSAFKAFLEEDSAG